MSMRVLGIETSCDETACAVLECSDERISILADEVSSQVDLHALYGGVVPELASREHLRNLPLLLPQALAKAAGEPELIAVTVGPGLKGCLLVGLDFVKGYALAKGVPFVGVNHIEGHLLSALLDNPELQARPFPYVALVVSGGHTELQFVHGVGRYELLARTTDDAAGEAFDKAAALLGLPYPGGPRLAKLADSVSSSRFQLPKVMRQAPGFSFSGLKTAVVNLVRGQGGNLTDPGIVAELAHAIQGAIVDTLVHKTSQSLRDRGIRTLIVCGGVSANRLLRQELSALPNVKTYFPEMRHSIDNAAMIAYAGWQRYRLGGRSDHRLQVRPRWPVETV